MNLSGLKAEQKPFPPVVDKDYAMWIEKIPSVIDGTMDRTIRGYNYVYTTDGHHIHTKGARGGDYWRIPLTRAQHQLCHSRGNKYVESRHGLDFHEIVCKLLKSKFGFSIPDDDWEGAAKTMVSMAEERFHNG